ncbi:MAG: aspartate carbamoyltransferase catalytic subunit [Actinobacteria bacterium]|nr:aspartate carbamoyltransferase catalytic subunit [Actinomycetota bacterium]
MGHLLSIEDLDVDQVEAILDTAEQLRDIAERPIKKVPTLRGRTVCNLFLEDSTRTRLSFEVAAKRLSADVINFTTRGSSVSKGESFKDTALTLRAMGVDAIVVRSHSSGAPLQLTRWVDAKVLNAGDGWHQHPTQALLDLYTIRRHLGRLEGVRVAIVGDVLHSRVARSEVQALQLVGADVTLIGPPTLLPPAVDSWGVTVSTDLDAALGDLDVLYLLRVQRERMGAGDGAAADAPLAAPGGGGPARARVTRTFLPSIREYARLWGVDAARRARLPDHAIVMHPGPMNRGVEIAADVADGEGSVITDQVTNGIAVRMALLYLMLGGGDGPTSAVLPVEEVRG